jgi:DNA polymerase III subunit epsilon
VRLFGSRRRALSPAAQAYRAASLPSNATPWRQARLAVVDLETTGLDPRRDEIISFASVPIDGGRVQVAGARTAIIQPMKMPPPETIRIHGLRPMDLADAPTFTEALDVILEALTGRVLVAHVAWVERGFLSAALRSQRLRLGRDVLDTAILARRALRQKGRDREHPLPLSEAARSFGLPIHRPHVAAGDALTTAQLFLAVSTRLESVAPQTVGSLARLSRG